MPAICANNFSSSDRGLQHRRVSFVLHESDQEMAWIVFGFPAERIAGDDRLPLLGGADEEIRLQSEPPVSFCFEQPLELRSCLAACAENQISALQQRSRIEKYELSEEGEKVGHRDHLVTGD